MDTQLVKRNAGLVWGFKMGQMVSLQIHIADRLQLFKVLSRDFEHQFVTTQQLAAHTKLHPRWLMELLRGLTAAQLLAYHEGTDHTEMFSITPEMAEVLANDQSSLMFNAGTFSGGVDPVLADLIVEAFHTGIGWTYNDASARLGEYGANQTKRMLEVWTKLLLCSLHCTHCRCAHCHCAHCCCAYCQCAHCCCV